jgi:hypothetical protein
VPSPGFSPALFCWHYCPSPTSFLRLENNPLLKEGFLRFVRFVQTGKVNAREISAMFFIHYYLICFKRYVLSTFFTTLKSKCLAQVRIYCKYSIYSVIGLVKCSNTFHAYLRMPGTRFAINVEDMSQGASGSHL